MRYYTAYDYELAKKFCDEMLAYLTGDNGFYRKNKYKIEIKDYENYEKKHNGISIIYKHNNDKSYTFNFFIVNKDNDMIETDLESIDIPIINKNGDFDYSYDPFYEKSDSIFKNFYGGHILNIMSNYNRLFEIERINSLIEIEKVESDIIYFYYLNVYYALNLSLKILNKLDGNEWIEVNTDNVNAQLYAVIYGKCSAVYHDYINSTEIVITNTDEVTYPDINLFEENNTEDLNDEESIIISETVLTEVKKKVKLEHVNNLYNCIKNYIETKLRKAISSDVYDENKYRFIMNNFYKNYKDEYHKEVHLPLTEVLRTIPFCFMKDDKLMFTIDFDVMTCSFNHVYRCLYKEDELMIAIFNQVVQQAARDIAFNKINKLNQYRLNYISSIVDVFENKIEQIRKKGEDVNEF